MRNRVRERLGAALAAGLLIMAAPVSASAGPAAQAWPAAAARGGTAAAEPMTNAAFAPGPDAQAAPEFAGRLEIAPTTMQARPAMLHPTVEERDARLFPGVDLDLFTLDGRLVPVRRGEMVFETRAGAAPSYWAVIPQVGRVWREPGDDGWSRAALPLMLVNDTENHAHQGLATFLYRDGQVTAVRFQFIQQTAPYVMHQHFITWGLAAAKVSPLGAPDLAALKAEARAELAARLPARPWADLVAQYPPGTLDGFGGPLDPQWTVALGLVKDGTLYYQAMPTPYGDYPYPLEMRFGVRSITKSVGAPLSLLRLAQVYGPWVLTQKIGDYVPGLDPKWSRIRFIDAADMATGFGGTGTFQTAPNDTGDGYLEGDYDAWYLAPSTAEKLAVINRELKPYPWEPGTVMRYRDHDFFLLGVAVDRFVKAMRGEDADAWRLVEDEVLKPIGVAHAPIVRTREPGGRPGVAWFNAGYYPTLDDLAKIALLYRDLGAHDGTQILHRRLTAELMAAKDAIPKTDDVSMGPVDPATQEEKGLYKLGFHFTPYRTVPDGRLIFVPSMNGSGDNQVFILPNGMISLRTAKAAELPEGVDKNSGEGPMTLRAAERMAPF